MHHIDFDGGSHYVPQRLSSSRTPLGLCAGRRYNVTPRDANVMAV